MVRSHLFGGGGTYDLDFDVFLDVNRLDDYFKNVDVYDSATKDVNVALLKEADYKIDVGLDHKWTLIRKAKRLNLYNEFVVADANKILPFEDNTFESIFSNIIYWLNEPSQVFSEIHRILRPHGRCCVMLPYMLYVESTFYYRFCVKAKNADCDFLGVLDRGRLADNLKVAHKRKDWEEMISQAGFEIEHCVPHLSSNFIKMWDIGLRPIFPFLKKMSDECGKDKLAKIKTDWLDLFMKLGESIVNMDKKYAEEQYTFGCYILKKYARK